MSEEQMRDFITELYNENKEQLFRFAYSQFKNHSTAEELVGDTFVVAWKNRNKLVESPNPEGWLTETMKNLIKHKRRELASRPEVVYFELVEDFAAPEVSESIIVESGLRADEENLIKMVYFDGVPMNEVAEMLHITPDACRKRVQRARDKLRRFLSN